MSNEDLVDRCNELARTFYAMQGYQVPADFKFYAATHPHEVGCWRMAVAAYEHIDGTEVDEVLAEMQDRL